MSDKKASAAQKRMMKEWWEHTGWEFLGAHEARASDPKGFLDLWKKNVSWLQDHTEEADAIIKKYRGRYDSGMQT